MGYSVRDEINDDIRLKQKWKKIKKGGTFIERELYQSEAFMSLRRTFSPKLLLLFLDKRMREPKRDAKDRKGNIRKPKFINLDNINMPYSELEKKYGVSRQTITRAIDELLEKGFIEILTMPNQFIKYRRLFKKNGSIKTWKRKYNNLNNKEKKILLQYLCGLIDKVKIKNKKMLSIINLYSIIKPRSN